MKKLAPPYNATLPPDDSWEWIGWIKNPPVVSTYQELKSRAAKVSSAEERLVLDRADGSGADCYLRNG